MQSDSPESRMDACDVLDPPPPGVGQFIRLSNPEEIQREAARVYRDVRASRLDSKVGARLSYMLTNMARMYELTVLERRLQELENAHEVPRLTA